MARLMLLGGARETEEAAAALIAAGHAVQVYWARTAPAKATLPACGSLRAGLAWADALLDTTHVFDDSTRAIARALAPHMPACRFGRALWTPGSKDDWTCVPDLITAVARLHAGARVFAATGRDSAEVLGHHDGRVFLRQLHHHDDLPPANCTFVFGQGPFSVDGEAQLLQELRIDVVLARNIGGRGSFPKLDAARRLGLPVVLLEPVPWAGEQTVTTVGAVLEWAEALPCN